MKRDQGFTILEIMIVVAAIGLLAAIAIPQISKARRTSQKNICIQNQRVIMDAVVEYEFINRETMDPIASNGEEIRKVLMQGDFFRKKDVFECPSSQTADYDDYSLTYEGTSLQSTVCQTMEDDHKFEQQQQ